MVDGSKWVEKLGVTFPLPIEVLPQARSYVARELVKMGGEPVYREGFITDYGNLILDVYDLDLAEPLTMEQRINNIVGVVCNGIFAYQKADKLLIARPSGVEMLE